MKRHELGDPVLLACGHTGRYIVDDYGICSMSMAHRPYMVRLDNAPSYGEQILLHLQPRKTLPPDRDVLATWYGVMHGPKVFELVKEGRRRRLVDITATLHARVVACIQEGHVYGAHRARMKSQIVDALRRRA